MKLVYLKPTNEVVGSSCFQLCRFVILSTGRITLVIITHDALGAHCTELFSPPTLSPINPRHQARDPLPRPQLPYHTISEIYHTSYPLPALQALTLVHLPCTSDKGLPPCY